MPALVEKSQPLAQSIKLLGQKETAPDSPARGGFLTKLNLQNKIAQLPTGSLWAVVFRVHAGLFEGRTSDVNIGNDRGMVALRMVVFHVVFRGFDRAGSGADRETADKQKKKDGGSVFFHCIEELFTELLIK